MISAIADFRDRAQEVIGYFDFLDRLNGNESRLHVHTTSGTPTPFPVDDALLKTLKATGFLLLYNLVESTMANAIQSIYDELKSKNIPFSRVRDDLKKIVLRNFKKIGVADLQAKLLDISVDIISVGFRQRALFSGNVDARLIRDTAKQYGFSDETTYEITKNGSSLVKAKNHRNDLAHGYKSFADVGKDHSIADLLKLKDEVVAYLGEILGNIDRYITDEDYLHITYKPRGT